MTDENQNQNLVSASDLMRVYPGTTWHKWRVLIDSGALGPVRPHKKGKAKGVSATAVVEWVAVHGLEDLAHNPRRRKPTPDHSTTSLSASEPDPGLLPWEHVHAASAALSRAFPTGVSPSGERLDELRAVLTRWVDRVERDVNASPQGRAHRQRQRQPQRRPA